MPKVKAATLPILILLLQLVGAAAVYGAPAAKLWPRWQRHDPESLATVDPGAWDHILARYVDASHPSGINRFKYSTVTPEDRQTLKDYLRSMQAVEVSRLNRNEQKAYWINVYNGLTVAVILDHYPVKSIRDIDISPGFFSNGPWDAKLLRIEGEKISLNDIEHRILRPIWQDNRIHYAVNCASLGCPNLQPRAYTPQNIEMLLDLGARQFINHPCGVTFGRKELVVSRIYSWFREDFGNSESGVIRHLQKYLSSENLQKLKTVPLKMSYQYNWNLNE